MIPDQAGQGIKSSPGYEAIVSLTEQVTIINCCPPEEWMDITLVNEAQTIPLYKGGNFIRRYSSYWLAEIHNRDR